MNEREAPESDLRLQAQAAPIADLQAAALLAVKLGHYRDHREAPAVLQALLDFAGAGLGDAITDSERAAFGPPFLFAPIRGAPSADHYCAGAGAGGTVAAGWPWRALRR
jgi:hypothetical protein